MISAVAFATKFTSFWLECLPKGYFFVQDANRSSRVFCPPLTSRAKARSNSEVNEIAFQLFTSALQDYRILEDSRLLQAELNLICSVRRANDMGWLTGQSSAQDLNKSERADAIKISKNLFSFIADRRRRAISRQNANFVTYFDYINEFDREGNKSLAFKKMSLAFDDIPYPDTDPLSGELDDWELMEQEQEAEELSDLGGPRAFDPSVISEWYELNEPDEFVQVFPRFPGCGFVDESQGDILVGNTLYEIKSAARTFRLVDFRQLLVYLALNISSQTYEISNIGLFNPRTGDYVEIAVQEFAQSISGKHATELFAEIVAFLSSGGISR